MKYEVSLLHPLAKNKFTVGSESASSVVVGQAEATAELIKTSAWIPAVVSGDRRLLRDVVTVSVLAYDYDDGYPLASALEAIKDYKHLVGTTLSHQKPKPKDNGEVLEACDRFRVILFLDHPVISGADYTATLVSTARSLGLSETYDKRSKDAVHWFSICPEVVSEKLDGRLVAPVSSHKFKNESCQPAAPVIAIKNPRIRGRLSRSTMNFIKQNLPEGKEWRNCFLGAVYNCKQQLFTQEEAASLLLPGATYDYWTDEDLKAIEDVYLNRTGNETFQIDWPEAYFDRQSASYKPVSNSHANYEYFLSKLLEIKPTKNCRTDQIFYTKGDDPRVKCFDGHLFAWLSTEARKVHLAGGKVLEDLFISKACENEFDPLMLKVNELTWDGRKRIRELFETIQLSTDQSNGNVEVYYQILRRWLIGMMKKINEPGSQNFVLVFYGAQGRGKSRWLERFNCLWPEGWGEGPIDPESRDASTYLIDNYFWHISELDYTTGRRDVGALKDFLTKKIVTVRRFFRQNSIRLPSICSFCATVNTQDFLHDATGNRRFKVIPVERMNPEHTVDMLQVFAEANHYYKQGERSWFNEDEEKVFNELNQWYLSLDDYIEDIFKKVVPGKDAMSVSSILRTLGYTGLSVGASVRSKATAALNHLKISSKMQCGCVCFMVDKARLAFNLNSEQIDKLRKLEDFKLINNPNKENES